jgi:methyl-accepting chemotaxis protein
VKNLTAKQMMISTTMVVSILVVALVVFTSWELSQIGQAAGETKRLSAAMGTVKDARFHVVQVQQFLTDVAATADEGGYEEAKANLNDTLMFLDKLMEFVPENAEHYSALKPQITSLHDTGVRMAAAYINEGREAGNAIMQAPQVGLDAVSSRLAEELATSVKTLEKRDQAALTSLLEAIDHTRLLVMILSLVVLTAIIGTMLYLYRRLSNVVASVRSSSENVASAAQQISVGSADLSTRTEEQASSLEETASSMEEMTATVKQNAENAQQANQLAFAARDQAEKGGEVVSNAITAMNEVNEASKKIADIIGVIDEIAFQTNLLALNAAVEAARAGEQGRGFAVVAGEVRNLAQRSADSAKQIKGLIQDTVSKVVDGSRLVETSGERLRDIIGAVKKVTDIVSEIAAASQEQSTGIEQVNKAVMQMDEVTQQNAALVEEAAAAARSMEGQAQTMMEHMAFFTGKAVSASSKSPSLQHPSPVSVAAPAKRSETPAARVGNPEAMGTELELANKRNASGSPEEWDKF